MKKSILSVLGIFTASLLLGTLQAKPAEALETIEYVIGTAVYQNNEEIFKISKEKNESSFSYYWRVESVANVENTDSASLVVQYTLPDGTVTTAPLQGFDNCKIKNSKVKCQTLSDDESRNRYSRWSDNDADDLDSGYRE